MTNPILAALAVTLVLLGACTSGGGENEAADLGIPIIEIVPPGPDAPGGPGAPGAAPNTPGTSAEPDAPGGPGGSSTAGFDGTWEAECEPDGSTSDREATVIDGSRVAVVVTTHRGAGCEAAAAEVRFEGRIAFSGRTVVTTGETAENVDLTLDTVTARYLDALAVASANEATVCGRADWQLGVSYDISDCPGTEGDLPVTVYDLLYRVDDVFYAGDEDTGDGETPATRPTGIDFTSPSRRVPG